jgi:hypothetical protein
MPLYTGCNLLVKIPFNYSKEDELIRFLESKLEGCQIKIGETGTAQPYAEEATVLKDSQLSLLQVSENWAPRFGSPSRMVNDASPHLLRAAGQAIEEFIENPE